MDEHQHDLSRLSGEDTTEQAQTGGSLLVGASDHSELQALQALHADEGAPSTPGSGAEGAWNFGKPAVTSGLPKIRRPVALALVVVLVVAAGTYFFLNRRASSGGTALALALIRDGSYSYDVHLGMEGTISSQGQQMPFNMQLDQSISWHVESTDSDGTGTVAVSVKTNSARFNGQPAPAIPSQTTRIRVAKDGRILSAGLQINGFSSNSDLGSLVPGSDQFMPLLPDHPVKVGDSWRKKFDQELPFGMGRLVYDVDSSLLRYEMLDGKRVAVLLSTFRLPLNMNIDLKKLLSASGNSGGQVIPGGSNARMKFGGSVTMQQTAWFDQARGELYRSSGNAHFDMTIAFEGFPAAVNPPTGPMHFTGTMNLQVQRVDTASKLTPKAQDTKAKSDLRNALAAAKVRFTSSRTYRGFTPAVANRLETSLPFNGAGKARIGQVSIRVATKTAILLVTRSASGRAFCIAQRVGHKITYGSQDARRVAGCRGGW
jgi:hypothetical protein